MSFEKPVLGSACAVLVVGLSLGMGTFERAAAEDSPGAAEKGRQHRTGESQRSPSGIFDEMKRMGSEAATNISKSLGAETEPNSKAEKGKKGKGK
ncbi:MAG: hypothetical protein C4293_19615 [Nitrospiraceae bacterium]